MISTADLAVLARSNANLDERKWVRRITECVELYYSPNHIQTCQCILPCIVGNFRVDSFVANADTMFICTHFCSPAPSRFGKDTSMDCGWHLWNANVCALNCSRRCVILRDENNFLNFIGWSIGIFSKDAKVGIGEGWKDDERVTRSGCTLTCHGDTVREKYVVSIDLEWKGLFVGRCIL